MTENRWDVPLSDVLVDDELLEAARVAMASGWWSMGPRVEAFEEAFADFVGARHALAVSNGNASFASESIARSTSSRRFLSPSRPADFARPASTGKRTRGAVVIVSAATKPPIAAASYPVCAHTSARLPSISATRDPCARAALNACQP